MKDYCPLHECKMNWFCLMYTHQYAFLGEKKSNLVGMAMKKNWIFTYFQQKKYILKVDTCTFRNAKG